MSVRHKHQVLTLAALFCFGCGGDIGPTEPTPPIAVEFSLAGSVRDTAFRPLSDIRIEVIEGRRTGVFTTTDPSGRFELPGVFSDAVTIRVSKDGYLAVAKTYRAAYAGPHTLHFSIEPSTSSVNIAGEYNLTMAADSSCTELPDTARTRTYIATIVSDPQGDSPNAYQAVLTGASFFPSFLNNRFVVGVAGSVARFDIEDFFVTGIAEKLTELIYVAFVGSADLSVDGSTISGPFSGSFEYCVSYVAGRFSYGCAVTSVTCQSANHRVTLIRRR